MKKTVLRLILLAALGAGVLQGTPALASDWGRDSRFHDERRPERYEHRDYRYARPYVHPVPLRYVRYEDRHEERHDFGGPRMRAFHHPEWAEPHIHVWDRWDRGYWTYSRYHGHMGWWWVVDGYWFMYPARVYPYPDYAVRPVYVIEPGAPSVIVEQPPVIQGVAPSMPANQTSPTYTDQLGRTCREYQSSIIVDGATKPAYGTACLQPDGSWRVVQ